MRFRNAEGLAAFDFELPRQRTAPGVSALVRVRDEAAKIEHSLRSVLPVVDEVVFVDNGSDDETVEIARRVKAGHDPEDRIRFHVYPHRIARCGPEHADTDADSLHSLAYFNNWTASRATFKYLLKWDGDMILARSARPAFAALLRDIQPGRWTAWELYGQTVYRALDGAFYLARGEVNHEVALFPASYRCRFKKREAWEGLSRPPWLRRSHFEPVCFYELKYADEDEFVHWSTTDDFPGPRKQREWENFHRIRDGRIDPALFERLPNTFLEDQLG